MTDRRALPRFVVLAAGAAAALTFGLASPARAADEGGSEPAAGEEKAAEKVTPPTITNVDGDSTGYVVAAVAGAGLVVALGAVIANDRKRDADFVPAHH